MIILLCLLQEATVPGEIRIHATPYSIGIEWDLTGDADHDATCKVEYREGRSPWKRALPLFRVDYRGWYGDEKADRAYNMLAGSILFLEPSLDLEVRLTLTDADGGGAAKTMPISTRPKPTLRPDARTLHVAPGEGGGTGASEDPFRGLAAAKSAARPGDIILLREGHYGQFLFNRAGEPGRYIAWKAAGRATFDSIEVQASHVWIEGFTFRRGKDRAVALKANGAIRDNVYVRNSFTGFSDSIRLTAEAADFHISDNTIVGDQDPLTGGLSGEGVELAHSGGHVVSHNRISRVADGVSYPSRNCDIFGNDVFDVSDDGVELDFGYANNRVWGNRITNSKASAFSFQPMYCGPWYIVRNQAIVRGEPLKFRVQDRFLLANNTIVQWDSTSSYMHHLLTGTSRNNLFISAAGKRPLWVAGDVGDRRHSLPPVYAASWKTSVDHDGFDWGAAPEAFRWENGAKRFYDVPSFAKAVGIEQHGLRVRKEEIFESWKIPAEEGLVPVHDLRLKPGSAAIDVGAILPNIHDGAYDGKAPDLGALESGRPSPQYGPYRF